MDIRPEAETIASNLPNAHRIFISGPSGPVTEITRFLSEPHLQPWAPFPVTALTNVIAAAADQPADDDAVARTCIRYLEDTEPGTMVSAWRTHFLDAVRAATESCLNDAETDFHRDDLRSGADHLTLAVNCALIGQAATRGWPHATPDDDLNAIVGLLTGHLPQDEDDFEKWHNSIPQQDLTLSSAYGAIKHIKRAIDAGYFHDSGYTTDMATDCARQAVGLISELENQTV